MIARVLAAGLAVAALYLAVLGVGGAFAQDAPPELTEPLPAATAIADPSATASPFPSPVETTVPAADGAPTVTPSATPSPTATATPRRRRASRPAARKRAAAQRRTRKTGANARKATGCALESTVKRSSSASTSASDCTKKQVRSYKVRRRAAARVAPVRRRDGRPTRSNPAASFAVPGAAPIGVPNFFIEKFRIPPFLLPIYQAAGMEYGVRWEVLAAINEIETDYGRNLNVSSAGALGWMQFMPATWKAYGVDANRDGLEDPYNPVDAIFAAARYLRAAGAERDLREAVFAYNHADWYVDSVLMRARVIGGLPADLVGSLTGLTQGRFPVAAKATYAGELKGRARTQRTTKGNAAYVVEADARRRSIDVFARRGARVVAVNDGRVTKIGRSERLGRFVSLRDVHGNTYTYAHLGKVSKTYLAPKARTVTPKQIAKELDLPRDAKPTRAASATTRAERERRTRARATRARRAAAAKALRTAATPASAAPTHERRSAATSAPAAPTKERLTARTSAPAAPTKERLTAKTSAPATPSKERLFAHPDRPHARAAGGDEQLARAEYDPRDALRLGLDPREYQPRKLKVGARVVAGTVLARLGKGTERRASHLRFEIRPAGRGAPRIDPKPILDGWKLLETTALYRAAGRNPFVGRDAKAPSIGQILLMSKDALQRQVLANPRIELYACGRRDVRTGQVDRRVLATLEYLAASGLEPTVTSLRCGHGYLTASGNVSHHSSGSAVDIAAVNGIPIVGHQGRGSITDLTIQRLLTLQGTLKPDQIISLMTFEGAANTFAMSDHHDHVHVGWRPLYGSSRKEARRIDAVLRPKQWIKLIDRLGEIDNPKVRLSPSKYAVKAVKRASDAHAGE